MLLCMCTVCIHSQKKTSLVIAFCSGFFISQVERNTGGAHILACAPSNSAADQLGEKLIASQHVDARNIYRIYASSRNPKDIPKVLEVSACVNYQYIQRYSTVQASAMKCSIRNMFYYLFRILHKNELRNNTF